MKAGKTERLLSNRNSNSLSVIPLCLQHSCLTQVLSLLNIEEHSSRKHCSDKSATWRSSIRRITTSLISSWSRLHSLTGTSRDFPMISSRRKMQFSSQRALVSLWWSILNNKLTLGLRILREIMTEKNYRSSIHKLRITSHYLSEPFLGDKLWFFRTSTKKSNLLWSQFSTRLLRKCLAVFCFVSELIRKSNTILTSASTWLQSWLILNIRPKSAQESPLWTSQSKKKVFKINSSQLSFKRWNRILKSKRMNSCVRKLTMNQNSKTSMRKFCVCSKKQRDSSLMILILLRLFKSLRKLKKMCEAKSKLVLTRWSRQWTYVRTTCL